jgi:transketolase
LSKGHAALGYYCILNSFGIIELKELLQYNQDESRLTSHPDRNLFNSVMLSSGSLGMGLGFGCGLALAKKLAGESGRYFVLMGDGECNEGSVWESAWFASVNRLNNLVAIIDQNNIQAVATAEDFISGGTIADKFKAFGWSVHECAGHDISEIHKAISQKSMSPIAVIAHTSGSKSFVYEQNSVMWHYRRPTREEVTQFFEFHSAETKAPDIVRLLS